MFRSRSLPVLLPLALLLVSPGFPVASSPAKAQTQDDSSDDTDKPVKKKGHPKDQDSKERHSEKDRKKDQDDSGDRDQGDEDRNSDRDRDRDRDRDSDRDHDKDQDTDRERNKGQDPDRDREQEEPEPVAEEKVPEPPPDPNEPLYSLDASHQDAVSLIMEYARQANKSVTMLDTFVTRISVRFKDLPFEKGLRKIMLASDLDFVKDEDGYTVGLPCDLKVRFPNPRDKVVDGTYRCRRISAATLVKTIQAIMGEDEIKATTGPEFLTPAVESADTGSGDLSIKALAPTDANYHTHDVVFTGSPSVVARALSLARKFDQPRKQVRVNVRIVEITSSLTRELGIDWQNQLPFTAVEQPSASNSDTSTSTGSPTVNGLSVGKFNHNPLQVEAILNALETKGEAKTLSNPTLLVLDGEKSFILSGQKYVYPQVASKDSSGAPEYTVVTEKVGVYLQVGVQVGMDDDMVLSIYPQVTEVEQFQPINGGNYPIIATHEEQATVRAIKGDVIVLGGLKIEDSSYDNSSLPFLGNIPILGRLFSSPSKFHKTDELMIFLTPEIIEEVPPPLDLKLEVHTRAERESGQNEGAAPNPATQAAPAPKVPKPEAPDSAAPQSEAPDSAAPKPEAPETGAPATPAPEAPAPEGGGQ